MSMITYPLNDILYNAEDAELFHCTRTSGIFSMDDFEVSVSGENYLVGIGEGIGWIRNSRFSGKVIAQKESISLDLGLPDSVLNRIDSIVVQFDKNANKTDIIVKKGTAAENPTPPILIRTELVYELHLYQVLREAGELGISPDNILDIRGSTYYCGLMNDGTGGGSSDIFLDDTLTVAGMAADAKATGTGIQEAKAAAENAQQAIDDLPISVDSSNYTDIEGLRQVTAGSVVKSGNTVTITTTLQGGVTSTIVMTLNDDEFPISITVDGTAATWTWEGFE